MVSPFGVQVGGFGDEGADFTRPSPLPGLPTLPSRSGNKVATPVQFDGDAGFLPQKIAQVDVG